MIQEELFLKEIGAKNYSFAKKAFFESASELPLSSFNFFLSTLLKYNKIEFSKKEFEQLKILSLPFKESLPLNTFLFLKTKNFQYLNRVTELLLQSGEVRLAKELKQHIIKIYFENRQPLGIESLPKTIEPPLAGVLLYCGFFSGELSSDVIELVNNRFLINELYEIWGKKEKLVQIKLDFLLSLDAKELKELKNEQKILVKICMDQLLINKELPQNILALIKKLADCRKNDGLLDNLIQGSSDFSKNRTVDLGEDIYKNTSPNRFETKKIPYKLEKLEDGAGPYFSHTETIGDLKILLKNIKKDELAKNRDYFDAFVKFIDQDLSIEKFIDEN